MDEFKGNIQQGLDFLRANPHEISIRLVFKVWTLSVPVNDAARNFYAAFQAGRELSRHDRGEVLRCIIEAAQPFGFRLRPKFPEKGSPNLEMKLVKSPHAISTATI